jgi:hypothetical protein
MSPHPPLKYQRALCYALEDNRFPFTADRAARTNWTYVTGDAREIPLLRHYPCFWFIFYRELTYKEVMFGIPAIPFPEDDDYESWKPTFYIDGTVYVVEQFTHRPLIAAIHTRYARWLK